MDKNSQFETKQIHAGYAAEEHSDSLATPLYQTSTFCFPDAETGERRFAGQDSGYVYSRLGNPTVKILEDRIAVLENGEKGLAFGSGMAAVSAVLIGLTKSGDHILCSEGIYGCTFGLLQMMKEKFLIDHDLIAMNTEENIVAHIRKETKVIYIETPINPTMRLVDLELVVKVARKHDIKVVVDNTFSTPYLQRPIDLGCDVVLHSATKYIGGHGDVIAGLVVGKKDLLDHLAMTTQKDIGGIMAPFDAWLLIRGLKTLSLRMERHCENTIKIAALLREHPAVENIYYPGDREHPDFHIAEKQMKMYGGLISFTVKGGKKEAQQMLNSLKLIKIAVSLGDAETLIQHPATMTHAVVPPESRMKMGITDNLLRLSVGLEAWQDIWSDLELALNELSKETQINL